MTPEVSSSGKGNNKAYEAHHRPGSGKYNQAANSNAALRPKNGNNKPGQETNGGRQPPENGVKGKNKKAKKKSKNVQRQLVSQNIGKAEEDRVHIGRSEVLLEATDELPYIKIDEKINAINFADAAQTTDEQLVLFVDGSSSTCGPSSIASHGIPTPPPTPTSSSPPTSASPTPPYLANHHGGAAVVYKEADTWESVGFSLPFIHGSDEAEMRGLEQGFELALEDLQDSSNSRIKVLVFTDYQGVMRKLAKCLSGKVQPRVPAEAMAASKARQLRKLGMAVEVRWAPAHMGRFKSDGNSTADIVARNGLAYTFNLSEDRARGLAGEVHRMEDPFLRRPPRI